MPTTTSTSRELANLTSSYLTDGRRGLDSGRDPTRDPLLSERIVKLFHAGPVAPHACCGGRRLVPLHTSPNIFLVERFVSPHELDHLDTLITGHRAAFKRSHTDDADGNDTLSPERTSLSLALPKAATATIRALEGRATELVGLPPDHIEPLQIVSYADGASFGLHHDLGLLHVDGEEEVDVSAAIGNDVTATSDYGPTPSKVVGDRQQPNSLKMIGSKHASTGSVSNCTRSSVPSASSRETEMGTMRVDVGQGARRLVTIFVYLNTLPKGVGHTEFPQLGLSVRPQCGAALLFCNVLRDGKPDPRTAHRAAPVVAPHRKFGCNFWLTDVTMQAHAVDAPSRGIKRGRGKSTIQGGRGILSDLLAPEVDALNVPPPAALIGLSITKRFAGFGDFAGKVVAHDALTGFRILYSDGDEEDVELECLSNLRLKDPKSLVDRRVAKYFPGHGRFEGRVTGYDSKDGFLVVYEDGDMEHLAPAQLLRILLPMKGPKKHGKTPSARRIR